MDREPLSRADYALFRMDLPENRMVVTALLTFKTPVLLEQLKAELTNSLLEIPRFRQRIVLPQSLWSNAYWQDDPVFDLDRHIIRIQTPLPKNPDLLKEVVSRIMTLGIDSSHPLWQFYLIEHYGKGSALVARMHHAIADGISLVKVLLSVTHADPFPSTNQTFTLPLQPFKPSKTSSVDQKKPGDQILGQVSASGRRALIEVGALEDAFRLSASTLAALGRLLLSPADAENTFRGQTRVAKRAAWSPDLELNQVKQVGKIFGATINDVLISATTGAIRRYVLERTDGQNHPGLHSFVPVDLRRDARRESARFLLGEPVDESLGNRFGFAVPRLPVNIADPVRRLKAVHRLMDRHKASGEAVVSYLVLTVLGAVPGEIENLAARFWLTKGSAVMTNVAGPRHPLYLAGSEIDAMIGWVPASGAVGLGVSIFSYYGNVLLGIASDENLVPDPERIIEFFLEEYHTLEQKATHMRSNGAVSDKADNSNDG